MSLPAGKLLALHSGDGRVLWSTAFDPACTTTHLKLWRTSHDAVHAPEVCLVRCLVPVCTCIGQEPGGIVAAAWLPGIEAWLQRSLLMLSAYDVADDFAVVASMGLQCLLRHNLMQLECGRCRSLCWATAEMAPATLLWMLTAARL